MTGGKLMRFPMRNREMFTREINCQVLSTGEFHRILRAAIQALPHVADAPCREELKRALCDLLLNGNAAA